MNIAQLLVDTSRKHPQKKALVFKNKPYSFSQLDSVSNQYAGLLSTTYGIKKGAHIGILLNNCPEYIFSIFAILKTGAVVVPINR
ncbi:AMP-binding protein, partial [bacterium]|nr:AMP-binding protein [bacterium]